MANKRIKDLSTTAAVTASDDFIAVDGATNGTRKLDAYSPTFGGNLTVSGTSALGDATGGVFYQASLNSNNMGTGVRFLNNNASSRNWYIGSQNNVGNAVEITPSTANNGTTFSTPVWQISSAGNVTQTGNLTVSGTGGVTLSYASGGPTAPVLSFTSAGGALGFYQSSNTIYFTSASVRTLGFTSTGLQMSINGSATNPNIATDAAGSSGLFAPAVNSLGVTLAGAEVARFAVTTGNLLLGTTTDSGNGKLQLATHTTSAGGIGFGTDTSLYRDGTGYVSLYGPNADTTFRLWGGATQLFRITNSSTISYVQNLTGSLQLASNGTTALTLDSSQRCILAGALRLNNAYTASAVVPTGYVTIQDSTGTTYKVCVLL